MGLFCTCALIDVAGAALVADALRVTTTLTELHLRSVRLCEDMGVAGAILRALVGHPSLRTLRISGEYANVDNRRAFGAMLGALIAADAPALRVLYCDNCWLGDAGLAPIFAALPGNCHLRELHVSNNAMSAAGCA